MSINAESSPRERGSGDCRRQPSTWTRVFPACAGIGPRAEGGPDPDRGLPCREWISSRPPPKLLGEEDLFVAWVSIHRWTAQTLSNLLAEHLHPEKRRLEGELEDLRQARARRENGGRTRVEKRFAEVTRLLEELTAFIDLVTQCADRWPPPTTPDEPRRERDERYELDLDDSVMVNDAARNLSQARRRPIS